MLHIIKPDGTKVTKRQARRQAAEQSEATAHRLWLLQITHIMEEKRCSPGVAFKHLKEQVQADA